MGRVSTWVHWSIIGGVVSLCPLFVFLIACIIGWVAFLQAQVRGNPGISVNGVLRFSFTNATRPVASSVSALPR